MQSLTKLEPAYSIVMALGGFDTVSGRTGVHITQVYRWTYPRDAKSKGCGGYIPHWHHEAIFKLADEIDVKNNTGPVLGPSVRHSIHRPPQIDHATDDGLRIAS